MIFFIVTFSPVFIEFHKAIFTPVKVDEFFCINSGEGVKKLYQKRFIVIQSRIRKMRIVLICFIVHVSPLKDFEDNFP